MNTRRDFLALLGKGTIGSLIVPPLFLGCRNNNVPKASFSDVDLENLKSMPLKGIEAISSDQLELADTLRSNILIRWKDPISAKDQFGYNNDFTCFIPIDDNPDDGFLWVNHEYPHPLFVSGYNSALERTKEQIDKEMYSVGGSILRVRKENGQWKFVKNDPLNKRITGHTEIDINWDEPIKGSKVAIGSNSNCSGGITPWGTFLSCEENYDMFWGETEYDENNAATHRDSYTLWDKFYDYPTEHYGWVVEIDPKTGKAQKHIALGRFAHECCTLVQLEDERIVAYTGDDASNEFIYKFISSKPNSLKEGTLYVANTIEGKWLALDYATQPKLQKRFKNQTEVLIRAREAARLLGATPQNRPEDIEIDPLTGHVVIALTNNTLEGDYYGSMLKIMEDNNAYDSLSFSTDVMLTGGPESGFACPDNLMFDKAGNLWFTSDISGSVMNKEDGPYPVFKNNGLYVLIRFGERAGEIIQIASAPMDAELTGPWFSPDYKTLFLSVQHPGEQTRSIDALTSNWPHDKDGIPKPAVVTIEGDLIDKLNHLNELG